MAENDPETMMKEVSKLPNASELVCDTEDRRSASSAAVLVRDTYSDHASVDLERQVRSMKAQLREFHEHSDAPLLR
jgi:hypothetical protein